MVAFVLMVSCVARWNVASASSMSESRGTNVCAEGAACSSSRPMEDDVSLLQAHASTSIGIDRNTALKQASVEDSDAKQALEGEKSEAMSDEERGELEKEIYEDMGAMMKNSPCNDHILTEAHPSCTSCTSCQAGSFRPAVGKKKTYTGCQWSSDKALGKKMCRMKTGAAENGYKQQTADCNTAWLAAGGGQIHFSWWCAGNKDLVDKTTANPKDFADAVNDATKSHYWYDADHMNADLLAAIKAIPKMTTHALDENAVKALVAGTDLATKANQVWHLLRAFRHVGGNGCAAAKNMLSYLVLNKHGGMHLDASMEILRQPGQKLNAQNKADFKAALAVPTEFATFPLDHKKSNLFKVWPNDASPKSTIGSGQQYDTTKQSHADWQPTDAVKNGPGVDVWAIKSPKNSPDLSKILKSLLNRAENFGLFEGTKDAPTPGATTDTPQSVLNLMITNGACNGLAKMSDVFACTAVKGMVDTQTIQSTFLKSLSMAAVISGLLEGNDEKNELATRFNTLTTADGVNQVLQVPGWLVEKQFAQTHAAGANAAAAVPAT